MQIYLNSFEKARCRLCLREIGWVLTYPNRKRAPLDLPIKTHSLTSDADGHEVATLDSSTHFETCPNYRASAKPVTQHSLFAPPENPT